MKQAAVIVLAFGLLLCLAAETATKTPALFEIRQVFEKAAEDTVTMELSHKNHKETLYIAKTPLLDTSAIRSVSLGRDPLSGEPLIDVAFSNAGAQKFAEITAANIGKRLAILLEGKVQTAPVIATSIPGGRAQINGNFTKDEAGELVRRINRALEVKNELNTIHPGEEPK
jgi:preprotein translocase subunit SecD